MNDWIKHDGKGMPVPKGTYVQVRYRAVPHLMTRSVPAEYFAAFWDGDDILEYRIVEGLSAT